MATARLAIGTLAALVVIGSGGAASGLPDAVGVTEIYSVRPDGTGLVDLSNDPANDRFPAESPRGGRIAFVSDRDGFDAIYVMNDDGSAQRRLTDRLGDSPDDRCVVGGPVWSPNASTIAFDASCRSYYDDPRSFSSSIYIVPSSVGAMRERVPAGSGPSFSADGRFIAFMSQTNVISPATVGVVAVDGGVAAPLGVGSSPSWSPRGHLLAFAWAKHGLAVADAASTARPWAFPTTISTAAGWSPRGKLLALFVGGARPGIYDLYLGRRRPRRLVDLAEAADVYWSPNGRWLALRGAGSTYVVRDDGRYLRIVGRAGSEPAWNRESSFLALADPIAGGVAVTRLRGAVTTEVVSSRPAQGLTWTRDGGRVVFAVPSLTP